MAAEGKFQSNSISFMAFGDRILVEEDQFKSGYECPLCNGKGSVECDNCHGSGHVGERKHKCSFCSDGQVECPQCEGKGGLLVVPEDAQRRPTTGIIVSKGEKVLSLEVGQSVLYSNFCGHTVDLNRAGQPVVLRILHEPEVLCLVEGHLDLRTVRGKSEIAALQN